MARGWESKSIESQVEAAHDGSAASRKEETKAGNENARVRQGLLLSRAYVLRQIESSSNERYTDSLRQALADLDQKLSKLDGR